MKNEKRGERYPLFLDDWNTYEDNDFMCWKSKRKILS